MLQKEREAQNFRFTVQSLQTRSEAKIDRCYESETSQLGRQGPQGQRIWTSGNQ